MSVIIILQCSKALEVFYPNDCLYRDKQSFVPILVVSQFVLVSGDIFGFLINYKEKMYLFFMKVFPKLKDFLRIHWLIKKGCREATKNNIEEYFWVTTLMQIDHYTLALCPLCISKTSLNAWCWSLVGVTHRNWTIKEGIQMDPSAVPCVPE